MELIRPFARVGKGDAALAGGKGASLGEMTQAGIPVPPGYVILSDAFERFIEETDLNIEIDAILTTVQTDNVETVEKASEKIQALILAAKMPEDIAKLVQKNFTELGAEFVAVRSSATAEDSAAAAWAGQLDTYLNTTEATLLENVQRCWASLFTPRAIFYRFEKGLHATKISVAVVVQKMVNSDAAGIAFSVHPVTEDYNQLIIEAGFGLGEAVVSGQVTPDSYVITKEPREILDKNISEQTRGIYRKEGGGNEWRDIPTAEAGKQVLTDEQIMALTETVIGIEKHYGFPVDTEWAMEAGTMYITQSRPITTLSTPTPENFNSAPPADARGAASPITWAILAKDFNSYYLRSYIWTKGINRGGEVVKELASFSNPLAMQSRKAAIEYLYNQKTWADMHYAFVSLLREDIALLGRIIVKTNEVGEQAVRRGREVFDSKLNEASPAEIMAYLQELASLQMELYAHGVLLPLLDLQDQSFVEKTIREYLGRRGIPAEKANEYFLTLTTPTEDTFALTQEKALLQLVLGIQANAELKGLIVGGEPEAVLETIQTQFPDFYSLLHTHTQNYRWVYYVYVGPAYTEKDFLTFIRDALVDAIAPADKLAHFESDKQEVVARKKAIIAELNPDPFHLGLFNVAGTFVWAKPTRKDYQSHLYFYLIEGVLAEIAHRIGISVKDALSCTFDMLEEALGGRQIDMATVFSIYEHHVVVPDGNDVRLFYGDALSSILPEIEQEKVVDYTGLTELKGTTAFRGKVTGTVRIINTPDDMHKMESGDILVSIATTPSIVPAMQKAAAFVTEEGGITCHAAIIAREMRKPCIIGTKIATQVLKDGDTVEVDANAGVVRILKKAEDFIAPELKSFPWNRYQYMGFWKTEIFAASFWAQWLDTVVTESIGFKISYPGMMNFLGGYNCMRDDILKELYDQTFERVQAGKYDDFFKLKAEMDAAYPGYLKAADELCTQKSGAESFAWLVKIGRDLMAYWCFGYLIAEVLEPILIEKALVEGINQAEIPGLLPQPESLLAVQQQEARRLRGILAEKGYEQMLQGDREKLAELIQTDSELHTAFDEHLKTHGWIELLNYIGKPLTLSRLLEQLASMSEHPVAQIPATQKVSPALQALFEAASAVSYVRQAGAEYSSIFHLKLFDFLNETTQSLGLPYSEMIQLLPDEIIDGLSGAKTTAELKELIRVRSGGNWMFFLDQTTQQFVVITGEEDLNRLKPLIIPAPKEGDGITGQVGNKGKARGPVCVVLASTDFGKFKEGDVLVTTMTTPDFVILMQKSAAIVTDIGGMLSHAAIVSRELGKPCVIGTKFATQMLKDGDMVEVDADAGTVRSILVA